MQADRWQARSVHAEIEVLLLLSLSCTRGGSERTGCNDQIWLRLGFRLVAVAPPFAAAMASTMLKPNQIRSDNSAWGPVPALKKVWVSPRGLYDEPEGPSVYHLAFEVRSGPMDNIR